MKTQIEILMEDPEFRRAYAVEKATMDAAQLVADLMQQKNLSKAELARLLGKSRAWVTQILSGKENLTIRTLADLLHELGAELHISTTKQLQSLEPPVSLPSLLGYEASWIRPTDPAGTGGAAVEAQSKPARGERGVISGDRSEDQFPSELAA